MLVKLLRAEACERPRGLVEGSSTAQMDGQHSIATNHIKENLSPTSMNGRVASGSIRADR